MPFNASGASFQPATTVPIYNPAITEGAGYNGLTTAQCAANNNLTSVSVTSTVTTVEAAKVRTNGMIVVVPTDQPQVTFGNQNTIQGIPQQLTAAQQVTNSGLSPPQPGFAVPPGTSMQLNPFNDTMYAITPSGVTATIYYIDP